MWLLLLLLEVHEDCVWDMPDDAGTLQSLILLFKYLVPSRTQGDPNVLSLLLACYIMIECYEDVTMKPGSLRRSLSDTVTFCNRRLRASCTAAAQAASSVPVAFGSE